MPRDVRFARLPRRLPDVAGNELASLTEAHARVTAGAHTLGPGHATVELLEIVALPASNQPLYGASRSARLKGRKSVSLPSTIRSGAARFEVFV